MRVVCISDTHGHHEEVTVPDGDLLIHAGDSTVYGTSDDLKDFLKWFAALPHRFKVLIAGNHDWIFERNPSKAAAFLKRHAPEVVYLENQGVRIMGQYVWGSPLTPEFMEWAFNRSRESLWKTWQGGIPGYTDILVTHGPPFGVCDFAPFGKEHVGCEGLRARIEQVKPKLHVFGHIHDGYGTGRIGDTLCVNASNVNEAYEPVNKATVVDFCGHCKYVLSGDEGLDAEVHGRCGL